MVEFWEKIWEIWEKNSTKIQHATEILGIWEDVSFTLNPARVGGRRKFHA